MSVRKQKLLNDYISGAKKLRADDSFRDDMLDQIEQYESNTVSGVERISHRRSRLPQRVAAIAAAVCCVVGIGGYLAYRQQQILDPKLPVDSLSSMQSESSTDSFSNDSTTDPFDAKEPLLAQLAMVEEKIAVLEQRMAEEGQATEEMWEMMELESQKNAILTELCRGGELMIAHTRYQETAQYVTMQVVNGTDRTITLPSYYVCQSADGAGSIVGGNLRCDNQWNLRELSPHSSMTVYCELNTAGLYSYQNKEDNGESWRYGLTWGLSAGVYDIWFVETLSPDAPAVLTGAFTVENTVTIASSAANQINGVALTDIAEADHTIDHITMEAVAEKAAFYCSSGYDRALACSDILQHICDTNGRADWEASGIYMSVYHIGNDGNAIVVCAWERVFYVYSDPDTGECHTGSLLDIGTFGELD